MRHPTIITIDKLSGWFATKDVCQRHPARAVPVREYRQAQMGHPADWADGMATLVRGAEGHHSASSKSEPELLAENTTSSHVSADTCPQAKLWCTLPNLESTIIATLDRHLLGRASREDQAGM